MELEIWPEDSPSLGYGVKVQANCLIDQVNGRTFTLNESAHEIATHLDGSHTVQTLVEHLQTCSSLDFHHAWDDVISFLETMNARMLLAWQCPLMPRLHPKHLKSRAIAVMHGSIAGPKTIRTRATYPTIALAALRANMWFFLAGIAMACAIAVPAIAQGVIHYGSFGNLVSLTVPALFPIMYVSTIVAHELAHYATAKNANCAPICLRKGIVITIVHVASNTKTNRHIAMAGPLCGALTSLLWACLIASIPQLRYFIFVPLLTAALHLYSFFPWTADGTAIWHSRK